MAEKESLEYLESELGNRISSFDASRKFYRAANNAIILATATLSACATVLIGANQGWNSSWLSIPALIASSAVTVVAAYDAFLRSRDQWILKDDAWVALINLRSHIAYAKKKSPVPLSQDEIDQFYARYDRLLLQEHEIWRTLRVMRDQAARARPGEKDGD